MTTKTIVLIVLIVAAAIIECIFAPLFSVAQRPGKSARSRLYKMICATMFLLIGVLAFILSGNESVFARLMLIGLGFSWVGDLFLHLNGKVCFSIGFASFATAHIWYLCAYYNATKMYFPERKFITVIEVIIILVIMIATALFLTLVKKMSIKSPGMIASLAYGFVLIPMTVKAAAFSLDFIMGGYPHAVISGAMLAFGAIAFFLSDVSLSILMFNKPDKDNYKLKDFNVATYFIGQTLLALTILFIGI